jgi:hypothetical protein
MPTPVAMLLVQRDHRILSSWRFPSPHAAMIERGLKCGRPTQSGANTFFAGGGGGGGGLTSNVPSVVHSRIGHEVHP